MPRTICAVAGLMNQWIVAANAAEVEGVSLSVAARWQPEIRNNGRRGSRKGILPVQSVPAHFLKISSRRSPHRPAGKQFGRKRQPDRQDAGFITPGSRQLRNPFYTLPSCFSAAYERATVASGVLLVSCSSTYHSVWPRVSQNSNTPAQLTLSSPMTASGPPP